MKTHYKKQVAVVHSSADTLAAAVKATDSVLERKHTLLLRPLELLLDEPHVFSGWLSLNKAHVKFDGDTVVWAKNPIDILDDTYHYLNMDFRADLPAAECIWKHDNEVLQLALAFYRDLEKRLGITDYQQLVALIDQDTPQGDFSADEWAQVQAAHLGYQAGMEVMGALPKMARDALFYDIKVNEDLTVSIPQRLHDETLQGQMTKVLVPPPATKADELVAVCGGMFYGREAPGLPLYVEEGTHINAGDTIYIVEVMKMFNKIQAPFACTVDKVLIDNMDGAIVKQGQPLFKVTPDEKVEEVNPAEEARHRAARTEELLRGLI
ncbi:MAG: hypothetical protein CSA49_03220 [Gammaproteobacteria bacterium]|nr:MAG: hypothetical protein CSA49_03220 [Gammaproteobacteria bacterium]